MNEYLPYFLRCIVQDKELLYSLSVKLGLLTLVEAEDGTKSYQPVDCIWDEIGELQVPTGVMLDSYIDETELVTRTETATDEEGVETQVEIQELVPTGKKVLEYTDEYELVTTTETQVQYLEDGTEAEVQVEVTKQVPTGKKLKVQVPEMKVKTDSAGNPYWHINLVVSKDLREIANEVYAKTKDKKLAAALADMQRFFVVDATTGKPTRPAAPARVML